MYYQKIKNKEMLYFTPSSSSLGFSFASKQTIEDVINFSSEIGFGLVVLGKKVKIPINPINYYLKMIKYWKKADIVLATYPYICRPTKDNFLRIWESNLIEKLNGNKFSILYIVDLPIEQSISSRKVVDHKAYEIEERIFKSFYSLLVFNENMKKEIQNNYGIDDERFVEFEILDYGVDFVPPSIKQIKRPYKIIYAGALAKNRCSWIKDLPHSDNIVYEFFGKNGEWINGLNRKDIEYKGFLSPDKLSKYASTDCHFGIIVYDPAFIEYLKYVSTSKFSAYMVAGLPILYSSKYSYLSHLVNKYKVGLPISSFNEIPKIIDNLTEQEYNKIRNNCLKLGEKIRQGYFFKKAVSTALCSERRDNMKFYLGENV